MDAIKEMLANMDPTSRWVLLAFVIVIIIYIPCMILYMRKQNKKSANFAKEHPEVARVYTKTERLKMAGAVQEGLNIRDVDGKPPHNFTEGATTTGFFVMPGEHVVTSSFSHSRPGVMHKTVTKIYGPTKQKITVEAGKSYRYDFDYSNEQYSFTEIAPKKS